MKFTVRDIDWAVQAGAISQEAGASLITALREKNENKPSLSFSHVLYYLGGLIIIGAVTFYITKAWTLLGGVGHLLVALGYAAVFLFLARWLSEVKNQRIPAGILATVAVCMTPMAVYGVQEITGWWVWKQPGNYSDFFHWIKSGWSIMEVATIVVGAIALKCFRYPFITLPIAFSLWFLSMDMTSVLYGPDFTWEQRKLVSMVFGFLMVLGSFFVDRRTEQDYAFWGYLFGMIAFWGGLTALDSDSELAKFSYCCINFVLMAVSVMLQRRVFIVFGAIGVSLYLGHLARDVFGGALLFTFVLSAVGLLVIGLGLLYHKHEKAIEQKLVSLLPPFMRNALPQYRA